MCFPRRRTEPHTPLMMIHGQGCEDVNGARVEEALLSRGWDEAGGDQLGGAWGERAGRRGDGEQGEADTEDPPAAEAIAGSGRGDDAGGEGDVVRGERPAEYRSPRDD